MADSTAQSTPTLSDSEREEAIRNGDVIRWPLQKGMCGQDILALQENLNKLGITDDQGQPIPENGVMDDRTAAGARKMVEQHWAEAYDEMILKGEKPPAESREAYIAKGTQKAMEGFFQPNWTAMEDMLERAGQPVSRPGGLDETVFAPKSSAEYKDECELVSDNVGGGSRPTQAFFDPNDPNQRLYNAIREQAPETVSNEKVAEVALRASQGGIDLPDKIQGVAVRDERLVVAGNTPGYYAMVDLNTPQLSAADIGAQAAEAKRAIPAAEIEPQQTQTQGPRGL